MSAFRPSPARSAPRRPQIAFQQTVVERIPSERGLERGAHGLRVVCTQMWAFSSDAPSATDASAPMPKLLKTLLVSAASAGVAALAWRAASKRLLGPRHSHAALPQETASSQEVEADQLSDAERKLLLEELEAQL